MKQVRTRWYFLKNLPDFNLLQNEIRKNPYSDDNAIGFEIIDVKKRWMKARYIEKQLYKQEINHPLEGVEILELIRYVRFEFEIYNFENTTAVIKILNPPISIKNFIFVILEAANSKVTATRITFNISDFYDYISICKGIDRFYIKILSASSIPYSKNTSAKIELFSENNAYLELTKKYDKNQMQLDRMLASARINANFENLEITKSGKITYTPGWNLIVENYIRENVLKQFLFL